MSKVNRFAIALMVSATMGCGRSEPPAHRHGPAHDHEHGHGPIGHRFEKADQWKAVFDDPARDSWQKPGDVVSLMGIEPGQTVADIGAGTGYFLPHLSRAVGEAGQVVAVDIEPDMVRHMNERAKEAGWTNVTARAGTPTRAAVRG